MKEKKKVGQAEKLYNMLDENRSGCLESFELKNLGQILFKNYLGGYRGQEDIDLLTTVLDMDGDGKVNKADFISYIHQYVMSEDLYFHYSPLKINREIPYDERITYSRFGIDPKMKLNFENLHNLENPNFQNLEKNITKFTTFNEE